MHAAKLWVACTDLGLSVSELSYAEGEAVLSYHTGVCERKLEGGPVQSFDTEGFEPPGRLGRQP